MYWWVRQYQKNGILPEDGNGLSQTQSFMDALLFLTNEITEIERKLGIGEHRG